MKYRRFGRTGLAMPVISCGGMRYQFKWQDVSPADIPRQNQENLEATIHRAIELGINHIETARGYGSSEMQLGSVLPRLARGKILVQTKVEPVPHAADFLKTFDKSMNYLKLDYVDLLSLHGVNNRELLDHSLKPDGCLAAARQLQREGRVRFVGFSTHAPTDVIVQAIDSGEFDYVNLHWYFVNESNWPAIAAAARRDMGVFIISPNDKGGKLYDPPQKLVDLCAPLSPMAFNDLFCLSRPEVHTLSCGAARPADFDEHVNALLHYDRITEVVPPIEQRLRAEMERVLGSDWYSRWSEGLPLSDDMPGNINVIEILRWWSLAKSLDMVGFGRMRYGVLGSGDHWLPGNNAARALELDLAPALKHHPFAARIPQILREAHDLFFEAKGRRLSQSD